jgi:hypothetical protein
MAARVIVQAVMLTMQVVTKAFMQAYERGQAGTWRIRCALCDNAESARLTRGAQWLRKHRNRLGHAAALPTGWETRCVHASHHTVAHRATLCSTTNLCSEGCGGGGGGGVARAGSHG